MRFSEYFASWIHRYYANAFLGSDFYTAVSASKFFGGAIAKYILQKLENGELKLPLNIIDLGANNANLLNDIYGFLETLGIGVAKKSNFILIDSNAKIQKQDSMYFYKNLIDLKNSKILNNHNCIFIANELFDALPCEMIDNDKMAFIENNRLIFKNHNDKKILEICKKFHIKKGEIPLIYGDFCKDIANLGVDFIFIAFDYGDITPRNDFTMRLFYKHKIKNFMDFARDSASDSMSDFAGDSANLASDSTNATKDSANLPNLSPLFGKCDITYNVPFFLLDSAFSGIGAKKILSKRQDLALIEDFGILDLLQDFHDSSNSYLYLRESNKIKTLLNIVSPKFRINIYKN